MWDHLHWLTVLHEHKSFTAAAARLGVSKAAMSQHIAQLERAAGVALVQRTTRSVRLTEAGERLVEQTRESFEQIGHAFAGVRDLAAAPRGLLRVTAPVAFARQQLVARLPQFLQAFPEVRLELNMSDRLASLAVEGFDLAVRHTSTPPETHIAQRLTATRTILAASPHYLRERGAPQSPEQLRAHACLHYPRAEGTPAWSFAPASAARGARSAAGESVTVAIGGALAVNNSEALRDAAAAGLGIALLPDFTAQAALESGELVEVLPRWRSTGAFGDALYAVRPHASHPSRALQAFVTHLRQWFGQGFAPRSPAGNIFKESQPKKA
ncbi:LysR family transcriptional regulator [Ramlibacter sp. AN1015]|uniref:LysR family transcriptional regulator n=1 Tax=Ramlibacter sp. AN1015 TaxID=3133428 RepID=UPI0030C28051